MSSRKFLSIALAAFLLAGQSAHAAISFFQADDSFSISPQPEYLAVGDMNRDGLEDVIVISPSSKEVNILLAAPGQPSQFSSVGVGVFGTALRRGVAADVTRDGNPDLVIADLRQDGVWVLVGIGDGRVSSPMFFPIGSNPFAVAVADFDGVRGADIAVADQRLDTVTILLNDGGSPPRFTRGPIFSTGEQPETILAIDVNGDGKMDLVTLNEGGPRVKSVSVLTFQSVTAGLPVFSGARNFGVGERPEEMKAADLNNDERVDIVMLNRPTTSGNSDVNILLSRGDGSFDGPTRFPVPCPFFTGGAACRAFALALGDFDDNGSVDLAIFLNDPRSASGTSAGEHDALTIFSGRGDGQFSGGGVLRTPQSPTSAIAVDINGDNLMDLAAGFSRASNITAFTNGSTPGDDLGNGERCSLGGDCSSGFCIEGVCCASACEDNQSCALPMREGTCQRSVVPFVPCDFNDECVNIPDPGDDGICVDGFCCEDQCLEGRCDIAGFEGLCIPTLPVGAECQDERDCDSGFCTDGRCCRERCDNGFCGFDDGICRQPSDLGEPCDVDGECLTEICDRFTGVCCSEICGETEECNDVGSCSVANPTPEMRPLGDSCSDDVDCASSNCVNNVCCNTASCPGGEVCLPPNGECAPEPTATPTPVPQGPGSSCNVGSHCISENCVDFVCCVVPDCPSGQFCSARDDGMCRVGTPPPTPTATPVEVCRDVPCASGRICIELDGRGECVDECNGAFCPPDESCVPQSGGGEVCVDSCRDVQCGRNETCVIGNSGNPVCANPCGNNTFCEPGEICQESELGEPLCIRSTRSGGCAVTEGHSGTDLLVLALLPLALWVRRRSELERPALVRIKK